MTVKLNSYVSFKDNAREAIEFYQSIFGGKIYIDTFRSFASEDMPVDEDDLDKIMHGYLKSDSGVELMVADTPTGMKFDEGSRVTLTLNGDDEELLRGYWDKLADGGQITLPMDKAPWGDMFGMLMDKFGVNWMVDIGEVQE